MDKGDSDGPSTSGTLKVSEVAVASEPDDFLFEVSGGSGLSPSAIIAALKPGILTALAAYAAALGELEL